MNFSPKFLGKLGVIILVTFPSHLKKLLLSIPGIWSQITELWLMSSNLLFCDAPTINFIVSCCRKPCKFTPLTKRGSRLIQ